MSSLNDVAQSFSITGLLDKNAATQRRFPIEEIEIVDIADHPGNDVYSMDEKAIEALSQSILKDGLTDIPLVRKLSDGSFQMISGHRRKAAYTLLAKTDQTYEKMPCRIVEGLSDEQALTLLHTANYFVRQLSITEKAAATRALGVEVQKLRETNPSLVGVRTEDIKAEIISSQTGRKVSGKSIQRQEALAEIVENKLTSGWQNLANDGLLSSDAIKLLAKVPEKAQMKLHVQWVEDGGYAKRETTDFIRRHTSKSTEADVRLRRADKEIQKYLSRHCLPISAADRGVIEALARHAESLRELL